MPNLAHETLDHQGVVVKFPRKEQKSMSIKPDGFTGLPNFICDEGYLSELSGEAIKCLVFLNRYISGFHVASKAIGEPLIMKITGIKDKRTIRKYIAELSKFKLIRVEKSKGRSNVYFVTFDERLPVEVVSPHVPSASDAVTLHAPTVVSPHVPSSSDMACHSVKEIDLKENIKIDDDNAREDFQPQQNRPLNFVEYHPKDRTAISFKDLCKKYSAQIDFQDQAKINFPNHAPERIFENLKKMAQWSLDKSNHTPQKWMTIWLDTFMKNMPSDAELAAQQARKAKATPKTKPQKKYHRYGQAQYQQPAMRDVGGNHE